MTTPLPALPGTGAMHRLVLEHDWAATALGPIDAWPASLRTAVGIVLDCRLPMYLAWGAEYLQIYNDAYVPILGARHPAALGGRATDTWPEIWATVGPMWDDVMRGEPVGFDDFELTIERFGYPETRFFNFSYSPVPDDTGRPGGVLVTFVDTTDRVLAERRARFQLELSDGLRGRDAPDAITAWTCGLLGRTLRARRVGYALVDDDTVDVHLRGWLDGSVESIVGDSFALDLLGAAIAADLRAGRTVLIDDVADDPRTRDATDLYDRLHTPAALIVPVLRDGSLIALVFVGAGEPRRWMPRDATLVEDAAERTRAAVERAIADEARMRADAAHRFVLDRTFAAVVVHDAEGAITFSNPMASQLLGLSADQLQGRVPADPYWHFIHENGQPMQVDDYPFSIVRRTREPLHDYVVGIVPGLDQAPRWVQVNAYPELGADGSPRRVVSSFVDITRHKQVEHALRVSEHHSSLALEVAQLGTWVWDVRTGAVTMDAQGRHICGMPDGPLTLEQVAAGIHPDDQARVQAALQSALALDADTYNDEFRWLHPERGVVWTLSSGRALYEGEGEQRTPVVMIGSLLDITERRRMLDALRQADRRKDEFLAMLAHELRNPLAPISTAAELLRIAADDPERVRHAARIIGRQVGHMAEMVDDLLDVSRVTRGLVELERAAVDMRTVLAQAIEQAEPLLQSRRHRLVTDTESGEALVLGDRPRLVQVVSNLLNNAAKYTPPGGRIELALRQIDRQVELAVTDDGIGIDEALLPQVFDLFTQADRTPDRAQGGLGIGLALVRSVVQLHGGRVSAASAGLGRGSRFTVTLPLAEGGGAEAIAPIAPTATVTGARRRVLVVDDNADAADTLAAVLRILGNEASTASSGAEALRMLHASTGWDAFIVDIGMPDMTGYELVGHLRRAMAPHAARYIALSGYGQAQDRERSETAGFDHHLVKPADLERVQALLAAEPRPAR